METGTKPTFVGSIPQNYDRYLGPLLFVPYAQDLATRLPKGVKDVLELACGSGISTQAIRKALPSGARLVATDLSEGMLGIAQKKEYAGPVEWQVADATSLPFGDNSFDLVVSQFGVMFFPEKEQAMREVFRVLRPGGTFLFNVWDEMAKNDYPRLVRETVTPIFDGEPPAFYNIPFGYFDQSLIRTHLTDAGFVNIDMAVVAKELTYSAHNAAMGFIEGNPIVEEIRERGIDAGKVVDEVAERLRRDLGGDPAVGTMQAIVISARKP